MHTTRSISALVSAAFLAGTAQLGVADAQTAPPVQTAAPMTTPTKAPSDMMTPVAGATSAPGGAMGGTTPDVPGVLALDARALHARRTRTGYTLAGEALVNDACQAARFDPSLLTIFPPQFNLDQFRRPDRRGMLCIQRLIWVVAQPRSVASAYPPAYVTVRTKKRVIRVPIPR
ncbi:MAG: hypothetical protein M3N49_08865 [Candidatus Eremiobacteraeota bacterium]|nr:hypothetical protein [Candidatus Eremiobacteraeota bacterium]